MHYHTSWSDLASIVNDDPNSPAIWDINQSDGAGKLLSAPSEAEEFLSIAEWAFGPTGLPNLQILAFGDFSHKERFQKQQFLIRRKCHEKDRPYEVYLRHACGHEPKFSPSFCATSTADIYQEGSPVDLTRFLSACPASGLIESPFE
jgi:hypothetical protein